MRTRAEQVAELVDALKKPVCRPDYSVNILKMWLETHIREAEERAKAECAADTRRLDWLGECVSSIGGRHGEPLTWKIMFFSSSGVTDPKEIRAVIDAAMEVQNG